MCKPLDGKNVQTMHSVLGFLRRFPKTSVNAETRVVDEKLQLWFRGDTLLHRLHIEIDRKVRRQNLGIAQFGGQFLQTFLAARDENKIVTPH